MFVPMRDYGKYGFINDTPASMLPIGAWSRARNVRFRGNYIERALEPDIVDEVAALPRRGTRVLPDNVLWGQQFFDGQNVRFAVGTADALYVVANDETNWIDATRDTGAYTTPDDGYWQSFAWGNTVVFNNGVDIPQVFNPTTQKFVDLPRWGIITKDDGTEDFDSQARARVLVPYKSFLVALNVSEITTAALEDQPNTVWWSDSLGSPDLWLDPGYNPWDYNSAENLGGKNQVGLEDGPLQWAATLGEGLMLYNSTSCTQMLFIGGTFVMDFRRMFEYGCAGLYCATEYANYHYVVASDVMYIHDGNSVTQIAEDRVRDWFYRNVRNVETTCRTVTDYSAREVIIYFDAEPDEYVTNAPSPTKLGLVYNYEDNNFTVIDAAVDRENNLYPVNCMVYGLDLGQFSEVGDTWDDSILAWDNNGELRWDQFQGGADSKAIKVSMFWLTNSGLYRANQLSTAAPNKSYFVQKTNMDLNELDQSLTTNLWKHLKQVYPHIVGKGTMEARYGWSPNLEFAPTWGEYLPYKMLDEDLPTDTTADVKIDTRTTGRYLAIEYRFNGVEVMRFSGADMDVLPIYGR